VLCGEGASRAESTKGITAWNSRQTSVATFSWAAVWSGHLERVPCTSWSTKSRSIMGLCVQPCEYLWLFKLHCVRKVCVYCWNSCACSRYEQIEHPAKLLDYFSWGNQSNINLLCYAQASVIVHVVQASCIYTWADPGFKSAAEAWRCVCRRSTAACEKDISCLHCVWHGAPRDGCVCCE